MKGVLVLMLILSLFHTTVSSDVLMAGMGSSNFAVAIIGILGALLLRDNGKK